MPPQASWHLSRETDQGEAAERAVEFHERTGWVWREAEFREPFDHLAVALEILEMVCQAAAEREAHRDQEN
ncbi:molecular chaperone TorD family protein [Desulfosoma caldarium]|uniref:molecular chaperone TorD family protein n=1 Tax=Desulfosoma caldarium TaxID=610254 RepID=UPI0014763FF4|nr:molecular chaperone TorD family protein [Desulfosoma caldarium]